MKHQKQPAKPASALKVIQRRHALGLNQREAAALLGVSHSIIAFFESGRRRLTPERLAAILAAYDEAVMGEDQ